MENKKYKLILNIGYKSENVKYFDKLTKNRIKEIQENYNYIILYYDKFFDKYIWFDSGKVNDYGKQLFNGNIGYYCD